MSSLYNCMCNQVISELYSKMKATIQSVILACI